MSSRRPAPAVKHGKTLRQTRKTNARTAVRAEHRTDGPGRSKTDARRDDIVRRAADLAIELHIEALKELERH